MKIGILTLPFHTNYGGLLQAFALKTILCGWGHDVYFITISQEIHLPLSKLLIRYLFRFCKKYILRRKKVDIFWEKHHNEYIKEQQIYAKYTNQFVKKYLPSIYYQSFGDIKETDFDAIIVGSDQIWRKKYVPVIENSFLNFTKGWHIRRISYAPSFGTDNWEYSDTETKNCRNLLSSFDYVSVREKEGLNLCRKYLDRNVEWVLDPTFLLNKNIYIDSMELKNVPKSKGNLLCYIIDMNEEKQKVINTIAKVKGLTPFTVNSRAEDTSVNHYSIEEKIQPPVEEWLRGFLDADYIVTDSFHACAFSIIFSKQFLVYGNKDRGLSRFFSLLQLFGLENRIITSSDNLVLPNDYNVNLVHKILSQQQDNSIMFLKSSLH